VKRLLVNEWTANRWCRRVHPVVQGPDVMEPVMGSRSSCVCNYIPVYCGFSAFSTVLAYLELGGQPDDSFRFGAQ